MGLLLEGSKTSKDGPRQVKEMRRAAVEARKGARLLKKGGCSKEEPRIKRSISSAKNNEVVGGAASCWMEGRSRGSSTVSRPRQAQQSPFPVGLKLLGKKRKDAELQALGPPPPKGYRGFRGKRRVENTTGRARKKPGAKGEEDKER